MSSGRIRSTPNTEVLEICNTTGIEAFQLKTQLRWTGHVIRMVDDSRQHKQIFYSQLEQGYRYRGGQHKRFKDMSKATVMTCDIEPDDLEILVSDR